MNTTEREVVLSDFLQLITPFIRNKSGNPITEASNLIDDLNVNSARLVDIILETEDRFQIRIDDRAADRMITVGDAVNLIVERRIAAGA